MGGEGEGSGGKGVGSGESIPPVHLLLGCTNDNNIPLIGISHCLIHTQSSGCA